MRIFSYIVSILLIIFGVTFATLNAESVKINFYLTQFNLPLSLVIVLSIAIGLVIGLLFGMIWYIKQKRKIYRLKSQLKVTEKEVDNLRTMPISESR